jgi:hypothetical protein
VEQGESQRNQAKTRLFALICGTVMSLGGFFAGVWLLAFGGTWRDAATALPIGVLVATLCAGSTWVAKRRCLLFSILIWVCDFFALVAPRFYGVNEDLFLAAMVMSLGVVILVAVAKGLIPPRDTGV